jgi:two-component system, cell cycle response regulator CtrA
MVGLAMDLEDQVELLKQKLEALMGSSQEIGALLSLKRGMTTRLATILSILVKRAPAVVSRQAFHTVIYGDRVDGGPEVKIFDVHICKLRRVLRRLQAPGAVDTIWNAGYRANPALVEWVKQIYEEGIE